jgi:NAD(P)-dependent dehydrogenase (short-subunit alcohol dehydrogenase family)
VKTNDERKVAVVTGADRGLGQALTARLLELGYMVFAGQHLPEWPELSELAKRFPDALRIVPLDVSKLESVQAAARQIGGMTAHIDVLINNAGVNSPTSERTIREPQDYDEMRRLIEINTLGPIRMVEAFLPLMDRGGMKRLCFVSSEAGSINRSARPAWYGYCMSKAALNMAVRNLFNCLRPDGYTFRVYHPGWVRSYIGGAKNMNAELEPEIAAQPAVGYFTNTLAGGEEDRLVLRDWQGHEWPW